MEVKRDLPVGMKTRVIIRTDEDGRQVVTNDQGEELIEFTPEDPLPMDPQPEEPAAHSIKALPRLEPHHNRGIGFTSTAHEESKTRRKIAKKSRKVNRRRR